MSEMSQDPNTLPEGQPSQLVPATQVANLPKVRDYFPRVKEARAALREKALALLGKYESVIDKAIETGDLEVAATHTQWLIEHMPAEDGETIIDSSAAKPKQVAQGPAGPTIQIGFQLGGINTPKAIDAKVIDITSKPVK